ncbi:MAG: ABC transporter permease [Armatimonadota bacterium]
MIGDRALPDAGRARQTALWTLLRRNPGGTLGLAGVLIILVLVVVGPLVIPLDAATHLERIYQPPSWGHLLGTDSQGRDTFSQIVHGGRSLLWVAAAAAALSTAIAVLLGSLAALAGGRTAGVIMAVTDVVLTVPHFPLLAVLAAFLRLQSETLLAVILGLLSWPTLARAVRAQVLSLRAREFVEAAQALGFGRGHIIVHEILPNLRSYVAISFVLATTQAMYAQVGLVFLGLVPLASQHWGVMIQYGWTRGAIFHSDSVYSILAPIGAIAWLKLSLVSMARLFDDIFNPRLQES